jgi:hypothetical protein
LVFADHEGWGVVAAVEGDVAVPEFGAVGGAEAVVAATNA